MAFEYGLTISQVAKNMNVELTPEIVLRAEHILLEESKSNTPTQLACNMIPNIMAAFEPN